MRLIDADEVLKYKYTPDDCLYEVVEVDDILEAPTVDAVPVVHGRWVKSIFAADYYKCSECCAVWSRRFKFCPNCGVKMDGGEGE